MATFRLASVTIELPPRRDPETGTVSPERADAECVTEPRHRADYILERGVWRVSCRACGWQASDPRRRRLATRFRFHQEGSPREPLPDAS